MSRITTTTTTMTMSTMVGTVTSSLYSAASYGVPSTTSAGTPDAGFGYPTLTGPTLSSAANATAPGYNSLSTPLPSNITYTGIEGTTSAANRTTVIASSTSAASTSTTVITPTLTATHSVSNVGSPTPTGAAQAYRKPEAWNWIILVGFMLAGLEI
jgi:hypothetical protein